MAAKILFRLEQLMWLLGLLALAVWLLVITAGTLGTRRELERFAALKTRPKAPSLYPVAVPDQRLWSPARVRAWRDSLLQPGPPPLAVLRIRRLGIEVPVIEGTDESTLNRGAGHIEGTASPGSDGNSGIAGHRDGFFRGLKDISEGDVLELDTPAAVEEYRIERSWIVPPEDVSVLAPTGSASITLVTCYPFYFVGSAPDRFIVRAVRTKTDPGRTVSRSSE